MSAVAVGIDLGTTNSVVAISQGGKPRVLPTAEGNELIPSVVSFHPNGQTLVGSVARARRPLDPVNTVFSVKRLIGRPFQSEEVRRASTRLPFELREGPDSTVLAHTRTGDLALPEVSALVLREVRRIGEVALGDKIERAVVTVPANFNELQRTATKMAGQIADLDVIRILNEPTAAALAYGFGRGSREKLAIYDFGGGTFDVTLLELNGNVFEVLATAGDTFLGGDDIDLTVTERLADEMLNSLRIDARRDVRVFESLRAAAEQAKIDLSREQSVTVRLPEVGLGSNGKPLEFRTTLTREELEKLANPLIARTSEVCAEALKLAGLKAEDFSSVILVGGSSRMPAVRARVAQFFKREPMSTISPDTVVAMGASILAEALSGGRKGRQGQATMSQAAAAPPSSSPSSAGISAAGAARPRAATETGQGAITAPLASAPAPGSTGGGLKWGGGTEGAEDDVSPTMTIKATEGFAAALADAMRPGAPAAKPADRGKRVDPRADPDEFNSTMVTQTRSPAAIPTPPPAARNAIPVGRRSASMQAIQDPPPPAPEAPKGMDFGSTMVTPGGPSDSGFSPFAGASLALKIGFDGLDFGGPSTGAAPLDFGAIVPGGSSPSAVAPTAPPAPRTKPGFGQAPDVNPLASTMVASGPVAPPPGVSSPFPQGSHAPSSMPTGRTNPGLAPGGAPAPAPAPTGRTNPGMPGLPPAGSAPYQSGSSTSNAQGGFAQPGKSQGRGTFGGGAAPAPAPMPTGSHNVVPTGSSSAAMRMNAPAPAPAPAPTQAAALPLLLDVTPHTLSVETVGGLCEPVIGRNSTIPVEQTKEFATAYNDQDSVRIRISQGEARRFGENQPLGELVLSGITRAARGEVRIGVTFELDAGGNINVRAKELATGRTTQARINLLAVPSAADVAQMAQKQRKK